MAGINMKKTFISLTIILLITLNLFSAQVTQNRAARPQINARQASSQRVTQPQATSQHRASQRVIQQRPVSQQVASPQVISPKEALFKLILEGDNFFIKRNFEKAKESYLNVLKIAKEKDIPLQREIVSSINRDVENINKIPEFLEIEKSLKLMNTAFNNNKKEQGIAEIKKLIALSEKNEDILSRYSDLSFLKNGGYIQHLINIKILEMRKRGAFSQIKDKKTLIILELKNVSQNDQFSMFSETLPRSINSVLQRTGGYELFYADDFSRETRNKNLEGLLNFFKTKSVELVVTGEYIIENKNQITISLSVHDAFTQNNVANAIVKGTAGNEIFESIDKIAAMLDKYLISYKQDNFFQTLVLKLTGKDKVELERIARRPNIYTYDNYIKGMKDLKDKKIMEYVNEKRIEVEKIWKSSSLSIEYLKALHVLTVFEEQFEKDIKRLDTLSIKNEQNLKRIYETFLTLMKMNELDRLIDQDELEKAQDLINADETLLDSWSNEYPNFSGQKNSARSDLRSRKLTFYRAHGFRPEFVFKFGYYFLSGAYADRAKMKYPYAAIEFRFPILFIKNWLHLNLGLETGVMGVNSKALEPSIWINDQPNYGSLELGNAYRIYHFPALVFVGFRFKPLKFLDILLSIGGGIMFHKLDANHERSSILWKDDKLEYAGAFKVSLDTVFRITRGVAFTFQVSWLYSGPTKFHENVYFGNSNIYNYMLNSALQRSAFNMWILSLGVALSL